MQKELAHTLKEIQDHGSKAFYQGRIAKSIQQSTCLRESDFARYEVLKKKPAKVKWQDLEIYSSAPPAGGVMLLQSFLLADRLQVTPPAKELTAEYIDSIAKIQEVVQDSRSYTIGDPAFRKVSTQQLLSASYVKELASRMNEGVSDQQAWNESIADQENHDNTTHFVVVDKNGMMVSSTNTLSQFFGSGIYVHGFFLNDQLKNFSSLSFSLNQWKRANVR